MQRLSYAGFLLTVGSLLLAPVSAQNSARIQHVLVRGSGDAIEVEIQTSGAPVAPNTQVITGPDRILVDFPGAIPASELRALTVNRGALKSVRSGLFSNNPPITRIVLDLTEPQSYQISTGQSAVVLKLNNLKPNDVRPNNAKLNPATLNSTKPDTARMDPVKPGMAKLGTTKLAAAARVDASNSVVRPAAAAKFHNTALVARTVAAPGVAAAVSDTVSDTTAAPIPDAARGVLQPMPFVSVTFVNGMLSIHADKATLAQVLFEVQRQTKAEIAIPAGAEREQIIADLGPGPAREVLGSLLNGTAYNFIFVGNELSLERVILTLRNP
jgi:AMIN domain